MNTLWQSIMPRISSVLKTLLQLFFGSLGRNLPHSYFHFIQMKQEGIDQFATLN